MTTAQDAWKHWIDQRVITVRAPHGPLSLTGTHWLRDLGPGVPGVPGRWELDESGSCVALTATRHDGLAVDDEPLDRTVRLCPDTAERPSRITHGGRRLSLILRDGEYAVRVFDPAAPARASFAGIAAHPFTEDWALAARFSPYEAEQTVAVPNADGRDRGLALAGEVAFTAPDGTARTLAVSRGVTGALSAVFGDAEERNYRFRFVELPAPAADGTTVLDFNRAFLPPCAFADHFLCPFPPPGNRLPLSVHAGERQVLRQ
ncbi:uncharacterized protein (DUF1684 family) [Streptacidiphilus sp. MAP12-33]|uniref:DUF1684 domain-containing protein n=1 Tax=Streptacidiphilus sp. MAP12-33 TaxID=3156266 RepID=UPI0035191144